MLTQFKLVYIINFYDFSHSIQHNVVLHIHLFSPCFVKLRTDENLICVSLILAELNFQGMSDYQSIKLVLCFQIVFVKRMSHFLNFL